MAKTYPKLSLRFLLPDDPDLSFAERRLPEAAAQTFSSDSPLKLVGGGATEWISQADSPIDAFALQDGQNLAATLYNESNLAKVLMCVPSLGIEANLLGAAAADYVLAAGDIGATYDLVKAAALFKGYKVGVSIAAGQLMTQQPGWYIRNTKTGTGAVRIESQPALDTFPSSSDFMAVPGDTNARVRCRVISGVSAYY